MTPFFAGIFVGIAIGVIAFPIFLMWVMSHDV